MKTALILTYYWPPSGGAGVQRWLKFVKYLRDFGWEPFIFCPENPEYPEQDNSLARDIPDGIKILKVPVWEPYSAYKTFSGLKKEEKINAAFLSERKKNKVLENIAVWIRGNLFIPDARMFWIRPAVNFLRRFLTDNNIQVLISTGPPHSVHMIAKTIAQEFKIPWLADFRDPWTRIDFYKELKLTRYADRRHHRLEREVLKNASAVTVISQSMADDFIKILPRNYEVITNGFDHEDTDVTEAVTRDAKFSIAHIGTLVNTRNPVALWKALRELADERADFKKDLEIKLVGKVDVTVRSSISESGLDGCLRKIDYLPHDEVVRVQQQSQVLLLIINNTPNASMILTGKFFEYLAAKRPVLCIGPENGDAARILNETRAGLLADHGDVKTMKKHILYYYTRYKEGTLEASTSDIERFSRKELTRTLAKILDHLTVTH